MYTKNSLSILSFDLGNNLGIAFSKFNRQTQILNVIDTKLISIDSIKKDNSMEFDFCSNKCINTIVFDKIISTLIMNYSPIDIYVVEDAFIHFIRAYSSLLLYLNKLEEVIAMRFKKRLFKISPTVIKQHMTQSGAADKIRMMQSIYLKNDIKLKKRMLNSLSEHETDAVAVAYAFVKQFSLLYI